MKGSEFADFYGPKGLAAWEAAAFEAARSGDGNVDWPWAEVTVTDGAHTAVLRTKTDVFSLGEPGDILRMPLTPGTAQRIANLHGYLLSTPWLAYQRWRAAKVKLPPTNMVPNKGAVLSQWLNHSRVLDGQIAGRDGLVSGDKKTVVVSNAYLPGKVIIFGWYLPYGPDVFDDGRPMGSPNRQPMQPLSNVHGEMYIDYSHGIEFWHPIAVVDGKEMNLADLMVDPQLCGLVSRERSSITGRIEPTPLRMPRYPAPNNPAVVRPAAQAARGPAAVDVYPPYEDVGLAKIVHDYVAKKGSS